MTASRIPDYLDHMLEDAVQACAYVEGLSKEDFLLDKKTQQAVVLNLILMETVEGGAVFPAGISEVKMPFAQVEYS